MRRDAGLTTFDLVIMIFILAVVAWFVITTGSPDRCRSKHSVGQATIQDFSVALKAYETDFGAYPPDEPGNYITTGRKGSLIDLLSRLGPKRIPYYEFRKDQIDSKGRWVTLFGSPYKYRLNAGRQPPATPSPETMINFHSFDMWASGCGDAPACDLETSEPATKATMKNW
ncbi:MAG: hypothetical protein AAB074_08280 [Planctomycetota bacterium]